MIGNRPHRYSHFPVIGCACHACNYCRGKIGMADAPAEGTPGLLRGFDTMTTTPDSRIAAEWGAAPPESNAFAVLASGVKAAITIDTSTTAGKISVMAAYDRGEALEARRTGSGRGWTPLSNVSWDWSTFDYRIAPPPAARTALQRARDLRSRLDVVDSMAADGILCCLLTDIDYAPVVEVLERRISWDAADLSALPKGRYRLLRDDA